MVAAQQEAAPAIMSAQASCGHNATIAYGSLVPILLQKSLRVSSRSDSLALSDSLRRRTMMGRLNHDQEQLFYSFHLEEAVPQEHSIRKIAAVLDLSWIRSELAPFYPEMGRPSIDPELMIRMLIIGYVYAIRSERAICREVQVNLAYRWFCGL